MDLEFPSFMCIKVKREKAVIINLTPFFFKMLFPPKLSFRYGFKFEKKNMPL